MAAEERWDHPRHDTSSVRDEEVDRLAVRAEGSPKSWVIPAAEILAFQFLLNQFDRRFRDHDTFASDGSSIRRNLHRGWVIDKDPFAMNQFGHPYSGSIYHGFARSAGLDFWESFAYDFVGSAVWEVAGETDPPSLNDQITTAFAGSFLGEALFRTANLVLRSGRPSTTRSAAAALIAPAAAVNRFGFGDRFADAWPDDDPAVFAWFGLGARRNTTLDNIGGLTNTERSRAVAAFALDHGLPGKPGYEYDDPFDYYHFAATATSSRDAIPENIVVRGLLWGTDYKSGPDYDGIWGLYGTYEYFSPEVFRVSSTGLALGTTAQYLVSDDFALLGTVTGGVGYTAARTEDRVDGGREFRYGASPQAMVALRLVYDDVAMLELTANGYDLEGQRDLGDETILRAQLALTVRVVDGHAIGIQFVESRRDPRASLLPDPDQSVGALSVFYTLLSDEEFGVRRR